MTAPCRSCKTSVIWLPPRRYGRLAAAPGGHRTHLLQPLSTAATYAAVQVDLSLRRAGQKRGQRSTPPSDSTSGPSIETTSCNAQPVVLPAPSHGTGRGDGPQRPASRPVARRRSYVPRHQTPRVTPPSAPSIPNTSRHRPRGSARAPSPGYGSDRIVEAQGLHFEVTAKSCVLEYRA